ncbi:MAG: acyl carrier protein [Blastocatellia bacterium]
MSLEYTARNRATIQGWLRTQLAESLVTDPAQIDVREPFASYGLSSVAAISLTADLEDWLQIRLEPTLAWDYPTIELLARYLSEELEYALDGEQA